MILLPPTLVNINLSKARLSRSNYTILSASLRYMWSMSHSGTHKMGASKSAWRGRLKALRSNRLTRISRNNVQYWY
jgi:hypothetical protein